MTSKSEAGGSEAGRRRCWRTALRAPAEGGARPNERLTMLISLILPYEANKDVQGES